MSRKRKIRYQEYSEPLRQMRSHRRAPSYKLFTIKMLACSSDRNNCRSRWPERQGKTRCSPLYRDALREISIPTSNQIGFGLVAKSENAFGCLVAFVDRQHCKHDS